MAEGLCGPSEGYSDMLCTGTRGAGQVLATNKSRGQRAAGEAGMEDAGEKGFILLM